MLYAEYFEKDFSDHIALLTSCAKLHSDPMVYLDASGKLLGCNEAFGKLFGAQTISDIPRIDQWYFPEGEGDAFMVANPGKYQGKIKINLHSLHVEVRSEAIALHSVAVIGAVFKDTSFIERAKSAERYFQDFKKKFLVNISHEFRTPMNAIIGFTDLLKNTPLSSWQQEYVDLTSQSAMSMMRNIENLLELTQVESGAIHPKPGLFDPMEVFETFSMQFYEQAAVKEIQLMFLIDPHLPKKMLGDQDKILTVLRNLIQNAIKFTDRGGSVLVELLIKNTAGNTIDVEYAVTDTGAGIEPEKIKTLLRPFASSFEKQRRGKDGLGIGLSLSHKYISMMGSQLMLASEVGKGSRFSFRITHHVSETGSFDFVTGTKAVIYTQELYLTSQSALLYKYLELFNMPVKVVHDLLHNDTLRESDVLFIDVPHLSRSQIESIRENYPKLRVVPVIKIEYSGKSDAIINASDSVVTLPIMPRALHKTLAVVWNRMPKEYISESTEAKSIPDQQEMKILVAEDNMINLRLLETILRHEKFKVVAVDNGQKAVDAYLKERFDLVLMDIDMPVMDGLMATRLIKEIDKRDSRGFVPVIALTAHALIGDRERIVAAGLDAHLAKPIDKNFLLQTIEHYLKRSHSKELQKAV